MGVYINNDLERKLEILKRWTEERLGDARILIRADFNARTETKGGRIKKLSWEEETERERESKDKKINRKGTILCTFLTD